jgi:hypothetical protein
MKKALCKGGGYWKYEDHRGELWVIQRLFFPSLLDGRYKGKTVWTAESSMGEHLKSNLKKKLVEQINSITP